MLVTETKKNCHFEIMSSGLNTKAAMDLMSFCESITCDQNPSLIVGKRPIDVAKRHKMITHIIEQLMSDPNDLLLT